AVRRTEQGTELKIVSSQSYVTKAMTVKLTQWEREGWVGIPHSAILKCLAAEIKSRRAKTTFVVATQTSEARGLCREAAELAKAGARNTRARQVDLTVPAGMNLTGIRLQGNKQRIFYRGIREVKTQELGPRASTDRKLEEVRETMLRMQNRNFANEEIWRSVRNKDFLPRTAQFIWKAMHNAHRVGSYWKHIPECDDRAICQECGETENLGHILVECASPGQSIIWKAAEKLWREKESNWPEVSLGGILGCGLMDFRDEMGRTKHGTRRLYRILMSESAYTIWKLRNERVISRAGARLTEKEIVNKWAYDINQRLQQDVILANRSTKRNRPRLAPALVKDTWEGTLDNEGNLPENWLKEARVLVG
ncbi:hypothetical protein K438DRAFT_1467289, partial [Mycena galopus ATCC 62051]